MLTSAETAIQTAYSLAERFQAVSQVTAKLIKFAEMSYQVDLSNTTVGFDLKGRVSGWASCKICAGVKKYTLKFNREIIAGKHFDDFIVNTTAHEVAHIVCEANPMYGKGHDAGWRRVCIQLGGNSKTTHSYEVAKPKNGYDYMTTTGHLVTVSKVIHYRVQKGQHRLFKNNKGEIGPYSIFCKTGGEMPAVRKNV